MVCKGSFVLSVIRLTASMNSWTDLSVVDSETMKSSRSNSGPFQVAMCRVSQSGEVTFIWRNGYTGSIRTASLSEQQC